MGLIEICLVSLLSPMTPQEPVAAPVPDATAEPAAPTVVTAPATPRPDPAAATTQPVPTQDPGSPQDPANAPPRDETNADNGNDTVAETAAPEGLQVPDDPRATLRAIEQGTADASADVLLALTTCDDEAVACRAAWLLGSSDDEACRPMLLLVAERSPHTSARRQAITAFRRHAKVDHIPVLLRLLEDDDRTVRAISAQLLARNPRPAIVEPLLQLLHLHSKRADGEATTDAAPDVVAAVLALTDAGAAEHLLRMATAIDDGDVEGAGEALAYAFNQLSSKLPKKAETTALVAVLDHREPLLRRYAITRLAEIGDPKVATALEGRLGSEGRELRPLIEVAMAQIAHDNTAAPNDEFERAGSNARVLWAKAVRWWNQATTPAKAAAASVPVVLLAMLWLLRRASRRRADRLDAARTAELLQPSDDYTDDTYYDEDDAGDYDYDDAEYEDEEYAEGEYDEAYEDDYEEESTEWQDTEHATAGRR